MKDKNSILASLNEPQRKAVLHTEGPLMVIAGAGSGKTRVLTYRIAHMLSEGKNPYQILALTFTNKAATEMRERIFELVGEASAKAVMMGTFHSVFYKIFVYRRKFPPFYYFFRLWTKILSKKDRLILIS